MAYDEDLAQRIRDLVAAQPGLTEQKMFGGLAFLIGGNMAVAASGQGGILVRADPDESQRLVETTGATPDGDAGPGDAGVAAGRCGGRSAARLSWPAGSSWARPTPGRSRRSD